MPSDYKHVYQACFLIAALVLLIALGFELVAAWGNKQTGDTITEITRSYHLPPVLFYLAAGGAIGVIIWAVRHLPGVEGL